MVADGLPSLRLDPPGPYELSAAGMCWFDAIDVSAAVSTFAAD